MILKADAAHWRDRVRTDMANVAGCAAMTGYQVSAQSVSDVVDLIAGYIAAGVSLIEMPRRRQAVRYLEARGHVQVVQGGLIQPVGIRDDAGASTA